MAPEHEHLITDAGKLVEAGQMQDLVDGRGDEPQRIKANLAAQGESLLTEANRVFTLAIPIILTEMLSFFSYLCSTAQAGATGAQALSAYTLAKTVYHIMGVSVVVGLGGAADTFVGQAYGAGNFSQVGTYAQRGCMINIIVGLLSVVVWWLSGDRIMLLLGQNPSVVSQANELLKLMSPSVVMWGVIFPLHAYFAGQGMVKPLAVIAALGAIVTPIVNYIASVSLGFGIQGIAFANNILAGLNMLSLFVAMIWLHYRQPFGAKTWPGFQLAASLSEWPVYLRIALPSMAMICLDWWCFELMTVISGLHPDASIQIGAMGIMFVTHSLGFIITAGFGTAAATRAANELGAGHGAAARRATIVCVISGFLGGLPIGLALFLRGEQWARLFTTNDQVVDTIVAAMPWLVLSIMSDSIDAVLSGVLRGCGRQMIGFVTNLVTFWFIGIPLAYHLDIVMGLGARGVWMALSGVSLLQAIILLIAVGRFDWDAEAQRSLKLLASGQGVTAAEVRAAAGGPGGHHGVYEPLIGAEHA